MAPQAPKEIVDWFAGRVPAGWFRGAPTVTADEEIIVVGTLEPAATPKDVQDFRERSREERMTIAGEAEQLFRRRVSWGVEVAGRRHLFTTLGLPVMTRLRQPERAVLDTLIAAGVARSRSEALGWCVRLVGEREAEWLADLKEALATVQRARAKGPGGASPGAGDDPSGG